MEDLAPASDVEPERGGRKLVCEGNLYRIDKKKKDGSSAWKCDTAGKCQSLVKIAPEGHAL